MTNSNINTDIPSTYRQLYRLENLDDWKVHHDDVDIREYNVKTADGKTIGEVENLLVDVQDKKVRYIEVELNDDVPEVNPQAIGTYTERDGDRIIIVPVGLAEINKDDKSVDISGLFHTDFRTYPRYKSKAALTPHYEKSVHSHLIGAPGTKKVLDEGAEAAGTGVDFDRSVYDGPLFRDSKYRRSAMRTTMTGIV